MKLYEIEEQINELFNEAEIDEETGEVTINYEKLEALNIEKNVKVENIIKYYLDLNGDIAKFKSEIVSLGNKKRTLENKQKSIKEFLDKIHQGQKAVYGTHNINYRNSEKLQGEDIDVLPDDCVKTEIKPIASEIKARIKSGELFEGWSIVKNQNIQIK